MNIVLIIIVFGIIVFVHEFGHFIVAKMNKITVNEFAIGMGPAIFSFTKNETKYSLRILPLGGYCLMMGQDEELEDENAFGNKSVWVRMAVILAGPFFNFILSFILAIFLVHFAGVDPAEVTHVYEGSGAQEAELMEGDIITSMNGSRIYNYREITLFMQMNDASKPIEIEGIHKNGDEFSITVQPKLQPDGMYLMGIQGGTRPSKGLLEDFQYGALELRYWVKATVSSLKLIVTGGVGRDDVMGVVGMGNVMNDVMVEAKSFGFATVLLNILNFIVLLSVNIGVMNLLPIPALDGGRLLFLFIEAIRRKKIPQDKEAVVHMIGFVLLMLLMIFVFYNDIVNVFFKK